MNSCVRCVWMRPGVCALGCFSNFFFLFFLSFLLLLLRVWVPFVLWATRTISFNILSAIRMQRHKMSLGIRRKAAMSPAPPAGDVTEIFRHTLYPAHKTSWQPDYSYGITTTADSLRHPPHPLLPYSYASASVIARRLNVGTGKIKGRPAASNLLIRWNISSNYSKLPTKEKGLAEPHSFA